MHRSTFHSGVLAGVLALTAAAPVLAAGTLLAPGERDLVSRQLLTSKSAAPMVAGDIERAPVQFAWALESDAPLQHPQPFVAESRAFHAELDAAELRAGYAFNATGAGAVIRISPLAGTKTTLVISGVELLRDGTPLGADAIERAVDARQLKAAGVDFTDGTIAFRIAPALGSGRYAVRTDVADGRYLVHVHEPDSPYTAVLATASDTGFAGGTMQAFVELRDAAGTLAAQTLRGALVAPDGRVMDVGFALDVSGRGSASVTLPASVSVEPGLWELHGFLAGKVGGRTVLRDVKTSFAVALPTARLGGSFEARQTGTGLQLEVPLQVAAPGRYELRGVLHGTAADGTLRPLAAAHSARWLEGDGSIRFDIPQQLLAGTLQAPYELRDLVLNDQSRLARLESRERAALIPPLQRDPQARTHR